jgi:hypothetical protein
LAEEKPVWCFTCKKKVCGWVVLVAIDHGLRVVLYSYFSTLKACGCTSAHGVYQCARSIALRFGKEERSDVAWLHARSGY